jgi:hypothetical protein
MVLVESEGLTLSLDERGSAGKVSFLRISRSQFSLSGVLNKSEENTQKARL